MKLDKLTLFSILLLLLFAFLWFEIRPWIIRKDCVQFGYDTSSSMFDRIQTDLKGTSAFYSTQNEVMNQSYFRCVRKYGLTE